jgi:hypothetical protein
VGKLDFGRIGRVIDHAIDKFVQLILETRKGYNQTVYLFTPSGDNSVPCKEDRLIIIKVDGTGKYIAVATATESQGANPGEKIYFGRDQNGKIVSKIKMLNDGMIDINTVDETTGEAKGEYKRTIKGETTIIEQKYRHYTNMANNDSTIIGNSVSNIAGNCLMNIGGNLSIKVAGIVNINGLKISLN